MNEAIARIILTLDAASEHGAAIDIAVLLAARTRSPLRGVFVEDEDLLRLSRLRVSRQIAWGPSTAPYSAEFTTLHLRAAAERARRELAAAAARQRLEWSFEIVHGSVADALADAEPHDLVVAGGLSRPIAGHFRVASRWSASAMALAGPLLLARGDRHGRDAVVALLHGRDPKSARLLDAAARITDAIGGGLVILGPSDVAGFDGWVADRLAAFSLRAQIESAPASAAELSRRVIALDCRLLALEADDTLAERVDCDVLIVR